MPTESLTGYEVTLKSPTNDNQFGYNTWTMVWKAEDFGHAERLTLMQLSENGDNHSYIWKIELY